MAYVNQLAKRDPTRKNVLYACDDLTFKGIHRVFFEFDALQMDIIVMQSIAEQYR